MLEQFVKKVSAIDWGCPEFPLPCELIPTQLSIDLAMNVPVLLNLIPEGSKVFPCSLRMKVLALAFRQGSKSLTLTRWQTERQKM